MPRRFKPTPVAVPDTPTVPSSIKERVYRHVADRLRQNRRVSPTNNGEYGPLYIGSALGIDDKMVRFALAEMVTDGWLVKMPITGYSLTEEAPDPAFVSEAAPTHSGLPLSLAEAIGAVPGPTGPDPESMMEWALHHASRGLRVFPCVKFLGIPVTEKWFTQAATEREQIVAWWSEYPDADIAAVPDLSGHFVLRLIGEAGRERLAELELEHGKFEPEFHYHNLHGDEHLWFRGRAGSSRTRLGDGIEIIGMGRFVYLPPSLAPDNV